MNEKDELPEMIKYLRDCINESCGGICSTKEPTWNELKANGSDHYKTGDVEPIDLYRAGGMFRHFAICSIIKYAFRNRKTDDPVKVRDMEKIIDYARKLIAAEGE